MSENTDLVRSIVAPWERGDFSSVEWADPTIEFALKGGVDPTTAVGIPAMGEAWRRWIGEFEDFRTTAEGFRELDGDCVVVLTNNSGRGRRSGVNIPEASTPGATAFYIRDGKVMRLVAYADRDQALAELGVD